LAMVPVVVRLLSDLLHRVGTPVGEPPLAVLKREVEGSGGG